MACAAPSTAAQRIPCQQCPVSPWTLTMWLSACPAAWTLPLAASLSG